MIDYDLNELFFNNINNEEISFNQFLIELYAWATTFDQLDLMQIVVCIILPLYYTLINFYCTWHCLREKYTMRVANVGKGKESARVTSMMVSGCAQACSLVVSVDAIELSKRIPGTDLFHDPPQRSPKSNMTVGTIGRSRV